MARVPYVQREQLKPEEQKHYDAIAGSRGRGLAPTSRAC